MAMASPDMRGGSDPSLPTARSFASKRSRSFTSQVSRRSSTGLGGAQRGRSCAQLPPIALLSRKQQAPMTFDELYSTAKVRVAKKSAVDRKGGIADHLTRRSSLPLFPAISPSSQGTLEAGAFSAGKGISVRQAFGGLGDPLSPERETEPPAESQWAVQALMEVAGNEEEANARSRRGSKQVYSRQGSHTASPEKRHSNAAGDRRWSKMGGNIDTSGLHEGEQEFSESSSQANEAPEDVKPQVLDEVMAEMRELIDNIANGGVDGFSEKEIVRMRNGFDTYKVPGSADLHKDDLPLVLDYLGHVMTKEEAIRELSTEINNFDYMDFEEFITFMEKFIVYERDEYRKVFEGFDEDGSGAISLEELRKLTRSLGFITLRGMMQEALSYIDCNGDGELNFQEFITFLAIYRHSEGFTRSEVQDLHTQFDRLSIQVQVDTLGNKFETVLPPEALCDALVAVMGLQVSEFATKFGKQLASGKGLVQRTGVEGEEQEPVNLHFPEFLIMGRKVREAQRQRFAKEFAEFCLEQHQQRPGTASPVEKPNLLKLDSVQLDDAPGEEGERAKLIAQGEEEVFKLVDKDGSGGISEQEVRAVLVRNKFTPLKKVIDEIHAEVYEPDAATAEGELDFDELFDFMLIFRQRDGFLKAELQKFKEIFDKFDDDGSGEVSIIELSDMLRDLGYRVSIDDIHEFIVQVDENGSGQLDFREFISLMRLFREGELKKIRASFDELRGDQDTLPCEALPDLLDAIGQELPAELEEVPVDHDLSFDELVVICDKSRDELVIKERRKAGFTDIEIAHFQELFNKFDKDKSGDIDVMELQSILQEFGWQPRTKEEQTALMRKLDVAREKCREAGVPTKEEGSQELHFWTFVQLLRMMRTEHDKNEEEQLKKLQVDLAFSEPEVEEFRQIFRGWVRRFKEQEAELQGKTLEDEENKVVIGNQGKEQLSRDSVRRLIRSLGCSIGNSAQAALDEKVSSLDEEGRRSGAKIDFFGFLRLMRWLLDSNFAGIKDATA